MKINDINISKLAKVFAENNFFSEEKTSLEYTAYHTLIEVYDCMSQDGKDKLLNYYKMEKEKAT